VQTFVREIGPLIKPATSATSATFAMPIQIVKLTTAPNVPMIE